MSIFYVDLSSDVPGTGISSDPFGFSSFVSHTNLVHASDHTYLIRGIRDKLVENVYLNNTGSNYPTFTSWDMSLYGPWRLRAAELEFYKAAQVSNCVLQSTIEMILNGDYSSGETLNAFISCDSGNIYVKKLKGSTVKTRMSGRLMLDSVQEYIDCVLDCSIILSVDSSDITIQNTVCSFDDFVFSGTAQQFDWTQVHNWPDWDEGEIDSLTPDVTTGWRFSVLGEGIEIPGSGVYTGYSSGLFGEPRLGVGAFYFNGLPIGTASWVYRALNNGTEKRYRDGGRGFYPSTLHAPIPVIPLSGVMRNNERVINYPGEYTVVQP